MHWYVSGNVLIPGCINVWALLALEWEKDDSEELLGFLNRYQIYYIRIYTRVFLPVTGLHSSSTIPQIRACQLWHIGHMRQLRSGQLWSTCHGSCQPQQYPLSLKIATLWRRICTSVLAWVGDFCKDWLRRTRQIIQARGVWCTHLSSRGNIWYTQPSARWTNRRRSALAFQFRVKFKFRKRRFTKASSCPWYRSVGRRGSWKPFKN